MSQEEHGPPSDLDERPLPWDELAPGTVLYRSHWTDKGALYFSKGDPANRYDDPKARFGVCYASLTTAGAFAETFLRERNGGLVDEDVLKQRSVSEITSHEPLRLVSFYGAGLTQLRATAAVTAGEVSAAQSWAGACFYHPGKPDGICFRVRHDDDQFGVALFDRCELRLTISRPVTWWESLDLGEIIERYRVCLI